MTALTTSVNRDQMHGPNFLGPAPVAGGVKLYHNQAAGFDGNNQVVPASAAVAAAGIVDLIHYSQVTSPGGNQYVRGRTTDDEVDNSAGADGDFKVLLRLGTFKFKQKGGDELTIDDIGKTAYVTDDNTVQATGGGAAMGRFIQLAEDGGAFVQIPAGQYGQF